MSYKLSEMFWDSFFSSQSDNSPDPREIPNSDVFEDSINWLSDSEGYFLDFGCGSGNLLLRLLCRYHNKGIGIDLSPESIRLSISRARKYRLNHSANFLLGSVEILELFDKNTFDGIILANVLNCLYPEDGIKLINEAYRLLKPHGKVLLVLPEYIDPVLLKSHYFKPVKDDFLISANGLLFWNIPENRIEDIISDKFRAEDRKCVPSDNEHKIRLIHLVKI